MSTTPSRPQDALSPDEIEVRALYQDVLDSWNRRSADAFAASFAEDGDAIGFDGSQLNGQAEIAAELQRIFANHLTGAYVGKVRDVRLLSAEVAMLRAIVGMIPHGQSDIQPALNAIQTLIAVRHAGAWRIALFQTTPAQLHGRPELVQQMTEELRQLLA
ncbi:MAG: SgcJ/EcaC family oxidoreductase [Chloroflexota bacterium]|nr:SgcJ/EcaC family oxidoreductase [Chloroflexota bacterium]